MRTVRLGPGYLGSNEWEFSVWAPTASEVEIHIIRPEEKVFELKPQGRGYHRGIVSSLHPGTRYFYRLNGQDRPDPASRFQPEGIHGPSELINPNFDWGLDHTWRGLPLENYVLYELHTGAFTPEGTFDAIISRLPRLKDLGITAVELMPVAQFPGNRNWGYDGVFPFAAQNTYGGPDGLKRLVRACHEQGLAAVLDVVYNHLGPEGNYLAEFGPYFTDRHRTPWGSAVNFDGPGSDEVRRYFIENALHWLEDFRFDALRIDAVHAIIDLSAYPFLAELAETVHTRANRLGRRMYLISESDLNDARIVHLREFGGFGHDAQWNDDFHHAVHTLLTEEKDGYYEDFGQIAHLAKAYKEGFVYSGEYASHRRRRHGNSSRALKGSQFVVFSQNHDQVGNRMLGERLSALVDFESLKLAAGVTLFAPYLSLLFMGEEYGETAPFLYFVSHTDPELVEAVRRGRREEFASFRWAGQPPDPQSEITFQQTKLNEDLRHQGRHRLLHDFYKLLFHLRRSLPAMAGLDKNRLEAVSYEKQKALYVRRWDDSGQQAFAVFAFSRTEQAISFPAPGGCWKKVLDSSEECWGGAGTEIPSNIQSDGEITLRLQPRSAAIFSFEED